MQHTWTNFATDYNERVRQRQLGGWNVTIPVQLGPHAVQRGGGHNQAGKSAAHLQYNSPMSLYSTANAKQALEKDAEAAELLKIEGLDGKTTTIVNSPTLQAVLREDAVKRQTGHKPSVGFYQVQREYGPGYGPLRQYEEKPDTLKTNITSYNQKQDRSLAYPMWSAL